MMPPNQGYGMMNRPLLENRPVTTVFVGNICERAPDLMIRHMLQVIDSKKENILIPEDPVQ
jgi:hypothetical protein